MATRLAAEQASVPELATALAVAQKCSFSHASSGCLQAMAEKLTTGGAGGWQDGRQEATLATFDSATLARLVRSMSEQAGRRLYRSPPIFDVRPGGPGQAGGFTWAVPRFSRHSSGGSKHMERSSGGCLLSPWTEVAGFHWRLRLHPGGSGSGRGSHLSGARGGVRRGCAGAHATAGQCSSGLHPPTDPTPRMHTAPHGPPPPSPTSPHPARPSLQPLRSWTTRVL